MVDNVSATEAWAAGSGGTPDGGCSVDMVIDASLVVADTKLLRTRRSVCRGGTRMTLGSERSE
jgi:hypothetical protein